MLSRTSKGRYRLGRRLFELSRTLLDTTAFRIEVHRVMENLARCWEETVHLAVLNGVQAAYIEKRFFPKKDEYTVAILDAVPRISKKAGHALKEYSGYEAEEERDKQANIG